MKKNICKILFITLSAILVCGCEAKHPPVDPSEKVKLTLEYNNGQNPYSYEVIKNLEIIKPDNPSKEGSIFYCWCTDKSLTKEIKSWPITIANDTTLYAKYRVPSDYNFMPSLLEMPSILGNYEIMLSSIDDYLYFDQGVSTDFDFNKTNFLDKSYTKAFLDSYMFTYDLRKLTNTVEYSNAFLKFPQQSISTVTNHNGNYYKVISDTKDEKYKIGIENEYVYFEISSSELPNKWDSKYYNKDGTLDYNPILKTKINVLDEQCVLEITLDENNYASFSFKKSEVLVRYNFLNPEIGFKRGNIAYKLKEQDMSLGIFANLNSLESGDLLLDETDLSYLDNAEVYISFIRTCFDTDTCMIFGSKENNVFVLMDHDKVVEEYLVQ